MSFLGRYHNNLAPLTRPDVLFVRQKLVSNTLLLNKIVCRRLRRSHYCPERIFGLLSSSFLHSRDVTSVYSEGQHVNRYTCWTKAKACCAPIGWQIKGESLIGQKVEPIPKHPSRDWSASCVCTPSSSHVAFEWKGRYYRLNHVIEMVLIVPH